MVKLNQRPMKKRKEPKQLDFGFKESCPYCNAIRRLRERLEAKGWIPTRATPCAAAGRSSPGPLRPFRNRDDHSKLFIMIEKDAKISAIGA